MHEVPCLCYLVQPTESFIQLSDKPGTTSLYPFLHCKMPNFQNVFVIIIFFYEPSKLDPLLWLQPNQTKLPSIFDRLCDIRGGPYSIISIVFRNCTVLLTTSTQTMNPHCTLLAKQTYPKWWAVCRRVPQSCVQGWCVWGYIYTPGHRGPGDGTPGLVSALCFGLHCFVVWATEGLKHTHMQRGLVSMLHFMSLCIRSIYLNTETSV